MKYYIKFYFLLLVAFGVTTQASTQAIDTDDWPFDELMLALDVGVSCREKHEITLEELDDITEKNEFADNDRVRKYILCLSVGLLLVEPNGEIRKNAVLKKAEKTNDEMKAKEIVEKCAVEMKTPEETAVHLRKCLVAEDNKIRLAYNPNLNTS